MEDQGLYKLGAVVPNKPDSYPRQAAWTKAPNLILWWHLCKSMLEHSLIATLSNCTTVNW